MKPEDEFNLSIFNQIGLEASKAIFLLNGGASLATLTFIGTIAVSDNSTPLSITELAPILLCFAVGAGFIVSSYGANYLNLLFGKYDWYRLSRTFLILAILCAVVSLICYNIGIFAAVYLFANIGMQA